MDETGPTFKIYEWSGVDMEKEERKWFPVMALRDMVIMPGTSVHFDIQNAFSLNAVNAAMEGEQEMVVVTAKNLNGKDRATLEQLYEVGTRVTVRQVLKLPKGVTRVLFVGRERVVIKEIVNDEAYSRVAVEEVPHQELEAEEQEARVRIVRDLLKQCSDSRLLNNPVAVTALNRIENLELLVDLTTETVPIPYHLKQRVLETVDLSERTEQLISILLNEIEISNIRAEIGEKLKDCVNQNQREYVLREQMKVIRKELGEDNAEDE
ncbi:MAG: LON peptidase substrate-binding domain-containing protein, partial [Lachnospiraceae bacterium]|nr:LON peptidase substrate-binding domain-containing protein [Lachnospiraceae bacterium]